MRISRFSVALALLFSGACAPVVGTARHRGALVPQSVLTQRDLGMVTSATNLWDAIESLSPNFIHSRGELAGVAVDGVLIGSAERLRDMHPSTIWEVRRLTAADAFLRFGGRAPRTVLLVTTRKR